MSKPSDHFQKLKFENPHCIIDLCTTNMADLISQFPGIKQIDGRKIEFVSENMKEFMKTFLSVIMAGWAIKK